MMRRPAESREHPSCRGGSHDDEREARERRVGPTGGWFGRSTTVTRKRVELVILLTPRIVST